MLAYDGTTRLCCSIAPSQGYESVEKPEEEKDESEVSSVTLYPMIASFNFLKGGPSGLGTKILLKY